MHQSSSGHKSIHPPTEEKSMYSSFSPVNPHNVLADFMVVLYVQDTRVVRYVPLDQYNRNTDHPINLNNHEHTWYFMHGTPHEQSFTIGQGVRIPEGDALWGPMMVYETRKSNQLMVVQRAVHNLRVGTLTR